MAGAVMFTGNHPTVKGHVAGADDDENEDDNDKKEEEKI
jgi:hypothetical protein